MTRAFLVGTVAVLLAGCTPRKIPGTEIEDTSETRAVLDTMEVYRAALEARDFERLLSVVDPSFKDDAGTSSPEDDLDYASLKAQLSQQLPKLDEVKVELSVKRIVVGNDGTALAIYSYNSTYRLPKLNAKPQADHDLKQMSLKRADGKWKIASGI